MLKKKDKSEELKTKVKEIDFVKASELGGAKNGACWGVGPQFGVLWQTSGVSVAGNINTLACMKERSGRAAITLAASSLRFSSFLGFLSRQEVTKEQRP